MELMQTILTEITKTGIENALDARAKRKRKYALEVLLSSIESGVGEAAVIASEDAVLDAIYQYINVAQIGMSKKKLRYLSKLMQGTVLSGYEDAETYRYLADIVADMTYEEIFIVYRMKQHKIWEDNKKEATNDKGDPKQAFVYTTEEFVTNPPEGFPLTLSSRDELMAVCGRLQRTGLVVAFSAWGGTVYRISPLYDRLEEIAPIADMLDL